jgi:4-amino-4-deoxy-L-arabinose transferase-like glycosyltransferase
VLAILLLAFVLRVAWLIVIQPELGADAKWYFPAAVGIAEGEGYRHDGHLTAYFPVGYPAFLGAMMSLFGTSLWVGKVANLLLYMGILLLTYAIAHHLFKSDRVAQLSLFFLAIYPNHIAYVTLLFNEILLTFLLLLGSWLLLLRPQKWRLAMAGIVFGYAVLTKPQVLFVPALILGWQWWRQREQPLTLVRFTWRASVIYLLIVAVITPWLVRNYQVFDAPVFVSTNGGYNLYVGNSPYSNGTFIFNGEMQAATNPGDEVNGQEREYRVDQKARELAIEYIRTYPLDVLSLVPRKVYEMYRDNISGLEFNTRGTGYEFGWLKVLTQGMYTAILLLLVLFPFLWLWRRRQTSIRFPALPLLIIAYFTLVTMVFFGLTRFSFPIFPFMVMVASAALVLVSERRTVAQTSSTGGRS